MPLFTHDVDVLGLFSKQLQHFFVRVSTHRNRCILTEGALTNIPPPLQRLIIAALTLLCVLFLDAFMFAWKCESMVPNVTVTAKNKSVLVVRCLLTALPTKIALLAMSIVLSSVFSFGIHLWPVSLIVVSFVLIAISNVIVIEQNHRLSEIVTVEETFSHKNTYIVLFLNMLFFAICCLAINPPVK